MWFRVDDNMHGHPKARAAGLESLGLWTISGSFCGNYLTEGFVPDWFVRTWKNGRKLAGQLVAAGLWMEAEQDGVKGWQFHQWDERQPSKAQVTAEREATRARVQKWRNGKRNAVDNGVSNADGNAVTPPGGNAVTNAVGNDVSNGAPTRPDPNSPTESRAHSSAEPPKKTRGKRLPDNWSPPPELIAWASREHPNINALAETAKFCDYWHSESGAKASKIDWAGTWRNWIRNARPTITTNNRPRNQQETETWLRDAMQDAAAADEANQRKEIGA